MAENVGIPIRFIREYNPPKSKIGRAIDAGIAKGITDDEFPEFLRNYMAHSESEPDQWLS